MSKHSNYDVSTGLPKLKMPKMGGFSLTDHFKKKKTLNSYSLCNYPDRPYCLNRIQVFIMFFTL